MRVRRRSDRFRLALGALVLVASLLGLLPTPAAGQEAAGTPSATPIANQILARASQRLAVTETVHFALKIDGETFIDDGGTIQLLEAEGDLLRPDRVRTTFRAKVLVPTITIELITVGEQSWTTNIITGDWEPAPPEFSYRPTILFDDQQGIGPVMGRVSEARQEEDEEIDGREAYHVSALVDRAIIEPITAGTMTGSPVAVDLWVDRETDDLLRIRLTEPPSEGRDNPATWTLDLSDHGDPVAIEPPV